MFMKTMKGIFLAAILGVGLFTLSQLQTARAESGLVAYWDFSEGSGSTVYDKAGSNNGTAYGATWSDAALNFNGTSDYVKIPDNPSLNPSSAITISMWVKPSMLKGIALNKEVQYRLIAEDVNSTKPSARYRTTNTNWAGLTGASNLSTNTWQYVAMTYDGSKWRLYYNGQPDGEIADSGTIAPTYGETNDGNLYLGHIGPNRGRNNDLFFNGSMDDVKIYNRALSAGEIGTEYTNGRSIPPESRIVSIHQNGAWQNPDVKTGVKLPIAWFTILADTPAVAWRQVSVHTSLSSGLSASNWVLEDSSNTAYTSNVTAEVKGDVITFTAPTALPIYNNTAGVGYIISATISGNVTPTSYIVTKFIDKNNFVFNAPYTISGLPTTPQIRGNIVCSSWTYTEWSACSVNSQQTRSVISSSPDYCTGGQPVVSQSCTYVPPACTSWTYSEWGSCSTNGKQTRTVASSSPADCQGGGPVLEQACTPVCTAWEYSDWGQCTSNGKRIRIIQNSSPNNCQGGNPIIEQLCAYIPPACTSWAYSEWGQCSSSGQQSRSVLSQMPNGCTGGNPAISQSCTPKPTCTEDKWECGTWNQCSPSGIQSRSCRKVFDCPDVESEIPQSSQYCAAPPQTQQAQTQTPKSATPTTPSSFDQTKIIRSTVQLFCGVGKKITSQGTGTVIDSRGTILTNKHVVDGTVGCWVGFIDSQKDKPFFSDRQVALKTRDSSDEDIALLTLVNPNDRQLTYIDITKGTSSQLNSSTEITAFGYPAKFGDSLTFTRGHFSGYHGNYLRTTAILEKGNSGGGAYLNDGTFIGIPSKVVKGDLNSMGYILSIDKINSWLNGTSYAYNPGSSNNYSRISDILETFDPSTIESFDVSSAKIVVYKNTSKTELLPNNIGEENNAASPLFQITNINSAAGHYVYFGENINADPVGAGAFISANEFSPKTVSKDGTYYFIFKAKNSDGVVSNAHITEYRYKKSAQIVQQKVGQKKNNDNPLATRLQGSIILQVESHGEAYYVNPDNSKRYYLGRPADAFKIMRELGLGASHNFVLKYKNGTYPDHVVGKILIDVGDSGKAYYIYPKNKKAYYLGRPADAFRVMRELGLGISNSDLEKIVAN
jgi:hypothetical protein